MTTYGLITNKIIKIESNFFNLNYNHDDVNCIFKIMFNELITPGLNIKNKFNFFISSINNFYIKGKEEEFINYFCKIQNIYNILNRFVYNYKYNKAKIVVTEDFCSNELIINSKNVICLFQDKSKYLFNIDDLIKIINTSLTNSYMFFSEPLSIKNPYNNLPFNKSTLYNIYMHIRYKTDRYCDLLFKFFECDFNLTLFKKNNECLLRKITINNYVYKSTSQILENEILDMLDYFNKTYCKKINKYKIKINKEFPKDKLIKIFQPYLLLYFISQYSFLNYEKTEATYYFKQGLIIFQEFNPQFGRKKYKIIIQNTKDFKKKIVGKLIEFDDRHIKFNNIEKQNKFFLTDHLKYNEINYMTPTLSQPLFFLSFLTEEQIN